MHACKDFPPFANNLEQTCKGKELRASSDKDASSALGQIVFSVTMSERRSQLSFSNKTPLNAYHKKTERDLKREKAPDWNGSELLLLSSSLCEMISCIYTKLKWDVDCRWYIIWRHAEWGSSTSNRQTFSPFSSTRSHKFVGNLKREFAETWIWNTIWVFVHWCVYVYSSRQTAKNTSQNVKPKIRIKSSFIVFFFLPQTQDKLFY